jgi:ubiquinone/menaquinone biosynthesis C-methylase UbiE
MLKSLRWSCHVRAAEWLACGILAMAAGCARTSSPPAPTPAALGSSANSVKPGINSRFLDPDLDVDEWVERFETEDREIYDQRHEIVAAIGLRPGQAVADVGAGTGLFTALFASEVGASGKVYAVDIAPRFVELIRTRAAQAGLSQITGVVCTERSIELPPESVDVAFICDTYHHFEYPFDTMASIRRALRRNGELVVVDFHRIPGTSSDWVMDHVRAGQDVFTREIEARIEASGFSKIEELPLLRENYVLRFRKVP